MLKLLDVQLAIFWDLISKKRVVKFLMAKQPLNRLGERVFARLKQTEMTLGELEQRIEIKTGMFLHLGYLDKRLRGKRLLHKSVYDEIKNFLGESKE